MCSRREGGGGRIYANNDGSDKNKNNGSGTNMEKRETEKRGIWGVRERKGGRRRL